MKIKDFRAVIFDMDGVFFDTETLVFDVFRELFKPLQIDLTNEYQYKFVGQPLSRNFDDIRKDFGVEFETELMRQKFDDIYKEMLTASPPEVQEGIKDIIRHADRYGLKLALCTTSTRSQIQAIFKRQNKPFVPNSVFDVIVAGDEVTHKKPHPEPYLTVVQKLGDEPRDCLVLEDSLAGILSAKSAGCFCVGLRQPYNRHFDFNEADLVIDCLDRLVAL